MPGPAKARRPGEGGTMGGAELEAGDVAGLESAARTCGLRAGVENGVGDAGQRADVDAAATTRR